MAIPRVTNKDFPPYPKKIYRSPLKKRIEKPVNMQEVFQLMELRMSGKTYSEIGTIVGKGRETIRQTLKKYLPKDAPRYVTPRESVQCSECKKALSVLVSIAKKRKKQLFFCSKECKDVFHKTRCSRCYRLREAKAYCRECNTNRCKIWRSERGGNEVMKRIAKEQRVKFKEKQAARVYLNNRIQKGLIIKPKNCSVCFKEARIDGHHEDYTKPLEVQWVCRPCHTDIHKVMHS